MLLVEGYQRRFVDCWWIFLATLERITSQWYLKAVFLQSLSSWSVGCNCDTIHTILASLHLKCTLHVTTQWKKSWVKHPTYTTWKPKKIPYPPTDLTCKPCFSIRNCANIFQTSSTLIRYPQNFPKSGRWNLKKCYERVKPLKKQKTCFRVEPWRVPLWRL